MSNICIVTSSFPANKTEIYHLYIDDLIELLQEQGHTVTILTQNKRTEKENFHKDVEVIWFPWKMAAKNVLSEISFKNIKNIFSTISLICNGIKFSHSIAKEKKIDLFICLWIVPSGLYVYLKNIFFRKTPYLLWSLGSDVYKYKDNVFTRFILTSIIKRSKAVFADGFELCDIIKKISNRECFFLPSFHKINSTANNTIQPNSGNISFLYVGRLSHVKGIDILIDAFKILKQDSHSANYLCNIIGDGEMMNELQLKVKNYKLENCIIFLGRIVDEEKLAEYFIKSDCVIIPSRSESIPIVLSEAVQFGKPIITTDAGDMKHITEKYNLGLVAKKNDEVSLANKIKLFLTNPVKLEKENQDKLMKTLIFKNNSEILITTIKI